MAETLAQLMREVGLDPPAYLDAAYRPRPYARAQPRVMRSPTERANDPMLAPSERRRAYNQAQAALTPPPDAELGGATGVSPNQVADAGRQLWELTPVPPAQRLRQAIDQGNPNEAAQSAGTLALNTAGLFGFMPRGARGGVPRVPGPQAPPAMRRVWHVSPHEFQPEPGQPVGRFRTDLGGTGESRGSGVGALAYGPGGYFTESPGVRDFYYRQFMQTHGRANIYEAEIPHGGYMDFDTPFSRQPSNIREGLREIYGEGPIAPDANARVLNNAEAARMRARGVVGTSFRGGIQDPDPNLRNFAVFDGNDINLIRRVPAEEVAPPPRPSGAPDAGGGMRSTSDFDIGPLYRGHDGDPSTGHWRASEGMNGEGVYLTHDEAQANNWALRQAETDPTVHAVRVRGPIADSGPGGITFEEARAQGYRGLRYRDDHGYDETVIFDPRDVSPSLSRRAARSAPTTARVGGPPQAPSDATRGGAESAYLAQLRADGFDVDTPLYHGSTAQTPIENLRPSSDGLLGPGVYVTDSPSVASEFAVHDVGGGAGQVMPVYARGPFASTSEWRMIAETEGPQEAIRLLREQGYRGVRGRWGRDGSTQTVVFDPSDLRSRFGSPRPTPSDATRGGPPGPPDSKSYRSRKPPSGGFLLPRRKT